jgi:hypothetical protein
VPAKNQAGFCPGAALFCMKTRRFAGKAAGWFSSVDARHQPAENSRTMARGSLSSRKP